MEVGHLEKTLKLYTDSFMITIPNLSEEKKQTLSSYFGFADEAISILKLDNLSEPARERYLKSAKFYLERINNFTLENLD